MRLNGSQEPRIWVQPTINHRITLMNGVDTGKLSHSQRSHLIDCGHDVGYQSSILGNV